MPIDETEPNPARAENGIETRTPADSNCELPATACTVPIWSCWPSTSQQYRPTRHTGRERVTMGGKTACTAARKESGLKGMTPDVARVPITSLQPQHRIAATQRPPRSKTNRRAQGWAAASGRIPGALSVHTNTGSNWQQLTALHVHTPAHLHPVDTPAAGSPAHIPLHREAAQGQAPTAWEAQADQQLPPPRETTRPPL